MKQLLKKMFGPPDARTDALDRYRLFHRKEHKKVGTFAAELVIPEQVYVCGPSVHVMYRSTKVDPDTLENPKRPIDYIHEHDSWGVTTYSPVPHRKGERSTRVPSFIHDSEYLVLLGKALGLAYKVGAQVVELEERGRPTAELYTTTCGHALLVIDKKKTLEYLIWGGGLDVRPEGIVG